MSKPRIISLLPGCTEIACALGLTEQVVGRSHACDYPTAVRHLPACTSPRLNTAAPGHVIDQEVKTRLRTALSLYPIDVEQMKQLQPDIILTQDQCEVCAVTLKDVQAALNQSMDSRPRVFSLATHRLADLWDNIRLVAEALDVTERGK